MLISQLQLRPRSIIYIFYVSAFVWIYAADTDNPNESKPNPEAPSGLHSSKIAHDTSHIKEHYEGEANLNESAMSPEELEFHYFKLHDFDNNSQLDGLEIYKALTHLMPYDQNTEKDTENARVDDPNNEIKQDSQTSAKSSKELRQQKAKYYTDIVDTVLKEDDLNNDGYLTYPEYVLARKKEEAREHVQQTVQTTRT